MPLSHRTTFPATFSGKRVPGMHKFPLDEFVALPAKTKLIGEDGSGFPLTGVACRAGNQHPFLHRIKRTDGDAITVIIGRAASERERKHIAAVINSCIHGGEDVRAETSPGPANLIHREARSRRHAASGSLSIAEEAGLVHGGAGSGGGGMCAVAVVVARGFALLALVNGSEPRANEFAVAGLSRIEVLTPDAFTLPSVRDRAESGIVEAVSFGPNAGVEDTDDDISSAAGFQYMADVTPIEAEKLRRASGVEMVSGVGENGEDAGSASQDSGLGGCEAGRESIGDGLDDRVAETEEEEMRRRRRRRRREESIGWAMVSGLGRLISHIFYHVPDDMTHLD
uniref:Uncharacterized protein n=1 Tax=Dendrobium thyrsiflorum TaxID=117978 RepID=A0ABD0V004_DENTH